VGGKRGGFTDEQRRSIEFIVFGLYQDDKTRIINSYVSELRTVGVTVSRAWICRLFFQWGLTLKNLEHKSKLKYTEENIEHYSEFVTDVPFIDPRRLKYLDEASFEALALRRRRGRAPSGTRCIVKDTIYEVVSYNLTLCTSLTGNPIFTSAFRQHTCTSIDFVQFVDDLILNGVLVAGDFMICDNARIHCAQKIIDELADLLVTFDIRLVLLPTYSPELNPAELVFSKTKEYLRYHRGNESFDNELVNALSTVTSDDMIGFYSKAILHYDA
jgi:transposase